MQTCRYTSDSHIQKSLVCFTLIYLSAAPFVVFFFFTLTLLYVHTTHSHYMCASFFFSLTHSLVLCCFYSVYVYEKLKIFSRALRKTFLLCVQRLNNIHRRQFALREYFFSHIYQKKKFSTSRRGKMK